MDPTQIKKIQAMNRYKRSQVLDNLYFYSFTALACSVFCCVTLCLPYLASMVQVFFMVYMSSLIQFMLSSKLVFFIGNLIIFVLVVNSRMFSSDPSSTSDVYYDEYIQSSQTNMPQINPTFVVNKAKSFENKHVVESVAMAVEDGLNNLDLKARVWVNKVKEEDNSDREEEQSFYSSYDELNRRAEDFIARVNRQRKLELSLLQHGSY